MTRQGKTQAMLETQNKQPEPVDEGVELDKVRLPNRQFAAEYRAYINSTKEQLDAYIERELEKLASSGAPVLSSVLACPYDLPKTNALLILNSDPRYRTFSVQLVPGVIPPDRDYNGALVPANKRGKVLAAKIGLTSHFDVRTHGRAGEAMAQAKYGAKASNANEKLAKRQYMSPVGRYAHVEIYHDRPTRLDFNDAVAVLTRYGYGIAAKEQFWMVYEVE